MELFKKIKQKKSSKKYNKKQNIISLFQRIQNNFRQNYPKSVERFRKIKSKKPRDKINNYIIGETLGKGAFGKVKLGKHIPTGEKVAIKIITKDLIDINKIKKEIKILQRIKHINIIQLYEIIETKKHLYIIMEYCSGKDLFSLIKSKHHLSEIEACNYFQQIINGVESIHLSLITHRDLKPENILLDNNNKRIVITDFGLSIVSEEYNSILSTPCGTTSYAPPEVLLGGKYSGIKSDIWSCGIILYVMLVGNLPCSEKEGNLIYQNIITHNFYYPENLSSDVIDLIEHLLKINPEERYSFDEIKAHPWFNLTSPKLKPSIQYMVHKIPIDNKILEKTKNYGYDIKKVEESVINNKYNSFSAIYYLILKQFIKKGINSISDLFSNEYINYLKNYKNWIDLSKINDPLYKDYEIDLPSNNELNDIINIKNLSNEILQEENNINYISVNKSEKFDDIEEKNFEKYINADKMLTDMEIKFDNINLLDDSFNKEKDNKNIEIKNSGNKNKISDNLKELISMNIGDNESINKKIEINVRKSNTNTNIINTYQIQVNKKSKEKITLLNEELSENNKEKIISRLNNEETKFNSELNIINNFQNNSCDNNILKIIAEKLLSTTIFNKYLIHNKKSKTFLENKFYILQKYKNIIGLIERMRNKIFTKKLNDFNFYTFNEYLNDENDKMFTKNLIDIPYFNKFIQKAKETLYKKDNLNKRTFSKYFIETKNNKNKIDNYNYNNNYLYTSYSNNYIEIKNNRNKTYNKYKSREIAFTPNRNIKYINLKYTNSFNKLNTPYKFKNIIKTPKTSRNLRFRKSKEKSNYNSNTHKKIFRHYKSEEKIKNIYDNNPINKNKETLSSSSSYSKSKKEKNILNTNDNTNENIYLNTEINNIKNNIRYINDNHSVNLTSKKVRNNYNNKIYQSPKTNNNKSIVISPYKNINKKISVQLLSDIKEKEKNEKVDNNNINNYSLKELKEFIPINLNCIFMNLSPNKIIFKAKKLLMKKGYFCTNKLDEYTLKAIKGNSNIEIILYKLKFLDNINSVYLSFKIKNKNAIIEKNFLNKLINFINDNKV